MTYRKHLKSLNEKGFVIKDKSGDFIAGFDDDHEIVQQTKDAKLAMIFKRKGAAKKWAEDHVDAGYGFNKGYKIEVI